MEGPRRKIPFPPESSRVPLPVDARETLGRALAAPGPFRPPRVYGLADAVLVRWLYREWLTTQDAWAPLIQVAETPEGHLEEVVPAADGGWLHLPEVVRVGPAARLVVVDPAVRLRVPEASLEAILAGEDVHAVSVDPGLAEARAALSDLASGGVLLTGPDGSTLRALARWAWWNAAPGAPLLTLSEAEARPEAWVIAVDPATLAPRERAILKARLGEALPQASPPPTPAPPRPAHPGFDPIFGESPALRRVLADAAQAAPSVASVLLLAEPGVGKELFARAIHEASGRVGPFEAVDLGAVPPDLVESELFGHVRGAFTGAATERLGAFRRAHRGTLFLDELGNLAPASQARLLRVLQERVVRPMGSDRTVAVDVRVVSATNADIEAAVAEGRFRPDLLHRLNAIPLRLPPLRDRAEDIVPLAQRLLGAARGDRGPVPVDPDAATRLVRWRWPGNVRELAGLMQRAAAFSRPGERLGLSLLTPIAGADRPGATLVLATPGTSGDATLPSVEIAVPGLRERGAASVRFRIWECAAGRALTSAAVDLLVSTARSADQLGRWGEALATHEGVVDVDAVRHLPGFGAGAARSLVFVVGATGVAGGFEHRVEAEVAVLGRASSLEEVRGAAGDPRGDDRVNALLQLTGPAPAFVAIPFASELSRAQVMVRLTPAGLVLQRIPGSSAPTFARGPDASFVALAVGHPFAAVDAAEISVHLDPLGRRTLDVQVYRDEATRDRIASAFAPSSPPAGADETAREGVSAPPGRVWPLSPAEAEALAAVVLAFAGGDFSAWLRAALGGSRDAADARLAAYLLPVRPTQYCARLYAFPGNVAALTALRSAVAGRADQEAFLARLPTQLSALLG